MINVEDLSRRYGNFTAVDRVSFQIQPGEIVGLLGHNGAGKTTIMKMLAGYLEPSHGRIMIEGLDVVQQPELIQQQLGYLPENLPVYPEMYVADYLEYAATMRGIPVDSRMDAVYEVIRQTQLQDKALQSIATLSRGYKQRVGVAQALLHRPRFLILDEPTNGLDPGQTQHMRTLIQNLAKTATVILSTHIMQEVDASCDRVLILRNGRLVVDNKLDELRQSNRLLVSCDHDAAAVRRILEPSIGITQIETLGSNNKYHDLALVIPEGQEANQLSASITTQLVGAGVSVSAIHAEKRDLEAVFREANASEEVIDAA